MKKIIVLTSAVLFCVQSFALDYTPDKSGFKLSVTGYGAPNKSYKVTGITFKKYTLKSKTGKLNGATIDIDTNSIDTSSDLNNGMGATWPASLATIRNTNIINFFFKTLTDGHKISAKIKSIKKNVIALEVKLNGNTQVIPLKYTIKNNILSAQGRVDLLKFKTKKAFEQFAVRCAAYHQNKTWPFIDVLFSVPVK